MAKFSKTGIFLLGLVSFVSGFPPAYAAQRLATTTDIIRVTAIRDLDVSSDGKRAAFVGNALNAKGDGRETTLWVMDLEKETPPQPLTDGHRDSQPVWSPDGSRVAFLRTTDKGKQVFVTIGPGTEPHAVTQLAKGVTKVLWSPDGRQLAVVSPTRAEGTERAVNPPGVHIFTRANYRTDSDYGDFQNPAQIWLVDYDPAGSISKARQLTHGEVPAVPSFWSADLATLFYTTNDTPEYYYGGAKSSLRSIDAKTADLKVVVSLKSPGTDRDMGTAPTFVPSPDGRSVAFSIGDPSAPAGFALPDVFVMDLASHEIRNLTAAYDREIGAGGLAWQGNDKLIAINNDKAAANVVEINVKTSAVTPWWQGRRVVQSIALASKSNRMLAVASDPVTPFEIYAITKRGEGKRLTKLNQQLTDELQLTAPEEISYKGPSGDMIHGFLQKPPGFDPAKKYPMIVWAHGGPYGMWNANYNADVQAMAGDGYLVMYVNPRGSSSYGQAFASGLGNKWPGPDLEDVMAGVDYLSTRPYIDMAKLGMAGSSGGGVMTDQAIAHSDKFHAAVSISDIALFQMMWFIGDQPSLQKRSGKQPWESDGRDSPLNYAANIKTPTLFISGEKDYRTPSAAGGESMYRVLKYLHVPTALIRFDGAGHSIYSSTDARHPSLRIHYLLRWMDLYLKGTPAPEFDVVAAN